MSALKRARDRRTAAMARPRDRYSRFVNTMKFALPSLAFVLIVAALFWPTFVSTGKQAKDVARDALTPTGLRNFEMEKPVYEATDERNRPYRLTATKARQTSRNAALVTLDDPKAKFRLEGGDHVQISARVGKFDRTKNKLTLIGDVNVHHDRNYSFRTSEATFDIKGKSAWGTKPVYASTPKATVTAEGFRIMDKGATVIFTGKSKVVLNVDSQDMKEMTGGNRQTPEGARRSGQ